MSKSFNLNDLAAIQYMGLAGTTANCLRAIVKLIHFGDFIHEAKLVSCIEQHSAVHGFILNTNNEELVGIKCGFSSGYGGEGPHGLSTAIQLLNRHNVDINEYIVSLAFIDRLDHSCLLRSDLEIFEKNRPVRPHKYYDYVINQDSTSLYDNNLLQRVFPVSMPYQLIDTRIIDLALEFDTKPDESLQSAYRRLEKIVRDRTDIKGEIGAKLFSKAFNGDDSILYWKDEHKAEHAGKASLFANVYQAYRNPRAHNEPTGTDAEDLREFLLINELYHLEATAVERLSDPLE